MNVEIIYPLPSEQILISLQVAQESTVQEIIHQSGILHRYPEIDLAVNKVGIFNKLVELSDRAQEGDRIEIYRDLIIDPKTARRKRAQTKLKRSSKA